ncbi:MAG: hypothetical protein QOG53_443 [Frankiales bacterium]|nr:hypothetical protein [Frankiales bacterium]
MSRASRARRIAVAAAYGGGGLGLLGAATAGVVFTETKLARRSIGEPTGEPPVADGTYGDRNGRPALQLALLGDSSAAGLGVHDPLETPGALLAHALSEVAERPVRLSNVAKSGAVSADLKDQVRRVLDTPLTPHVAVIMIGTNDVTHRVRATVAVRHLDQAVRQLRAASVEVVVGTCPDLGTVRPMAQPLRLIARRLSRMLAAAQTIVCVEAGARVVSLGDLLGPEFAAAPHLLFGPDRFHPSAAGYATCTYALMPAACEALGLWPEPAGVRGPLEMAELADLAEPVLPVADAAAEAAENPGSEVTGVQVAGQDRGPRGRWARLRLRRTPRITVLEPPGTVALSVAAEE